MGAPRPNLRDPRIVQAFNQFADYINRVNGVDAAGLAAVNLRVDGVDTRIDNLPYPVITEPVPAAAASMAANVIGPLFGEVNVAPLGTGADDDARMAAILAACLGKFPVNQLAGAWKSGATSYTVPTTSNGVVYAYNPSIASSLALSIGPRFGSVTLAPLGTAGSSWARFISVANACATAGYPLHLAPGAHYCDTKQTFPSNLTLVGNHGVRIVQSIAYNGADPFNAAFSATVVYSGVTTTLHTDVVVGSRTVISDATLPVGTTFVLARSGLRALIYTVTANAGGGGPTYTLTVDRPILEAFLANDQILVTTSQPHDITILGNGMSISGTGDRYFEFAGGLRINVSDVRIDNVAGNMGGAAAVFCSYDIGSRDCHWRNIVADGGGQTMAVGVWIESGEHCTIENCNIHNLGGGASSGVNMVDCWESAIIESHADGTIYGCSIGTDGGTVGCIDCSVVGGSYNHNSVGVLVGVGRGCLRTRIEHVSAHYNSSVGMGITSAGNVDTFFSDVACNGNTDAGIQINGDYATLSGVSCKGNAVGIRIEAGKVGTKGQQWNLRDNTTYDLHLLGPVVAKAIYASGAANSNVYVNGAFAATLDDMEIYNTHVWAGSGDVAVVTGGAILHAKNLKIRGLTGADKPNSLLMIYTGNSGAILEDPDLVQTGVFGIRQYQPCTVAVFGDCQVTTGLWYTDAVATGQRNRGTFTLANGVGSAVPYRWLADWSGVIVSLTTPSGTPGVLSLARTTGTGFTPTGAVGDNSTYSYTVL